MKTFKEVYHESFRVIDRAQRRKIGMRMRRLAKTSAFKKKVERSKRRIASPAKIAVKARKMAKQKLIAKKFPRYNEVSVGQRIKIDQLISQRMSGAIDKLSKRLVRTVRGKELEKVKKARKALEKDT
jgi:hypothetical protein